MLWNKLFQFIKPKPYSSCVVCVGVMATLLNVSDQCGIAVILAGKRACEQGLGTIHRHNTWKVACLDRERDIPFY